jgi:hypothetical protein
MEHPDPQQVLAEKIQFLETFNNSLRRWLSGEYAPEGAEALRLVIDRAAPRAKQIVRETEQATTVTIRPPSVLGGYSATLDPFDIIFANFGGLPVIPALLDTVQAALRVLENPEYLEIEACHGD